MIDPHLNAMAAHSFENIIPSIAGFTVLFWAAISPFICSNHAHWVRTISGSVATTACIKVDSVNYFI